MATLKTIEENGTIRDMNKDILNSVSKLYSILGDAEIRKELGAERVKNATFFLVSIYDKTSELQEIFKSK